MARYYVSITLLLYLLALGFDAVELDGGHRMAAVQMLLYGAWGMVMGSFGWLANPLLGLALLVRRRLRWLSLLLGLWALWLALASAGLDRLPDNRGYDFHDVIGFGPGYYLWVLALVAFCAGQAWCSWQARKGQEMPRWRMLDGLAAVLLAIAVTLASQSSELQFEVEKLFEFPSTWKSEQPRNAI